MYEGSKNQEKTIRDIIEGPPRVESAKKFESSENKKESIIPQNEAVESSPKKAIQIAPDMAHKIALSLLPNQEFTKNLKEIIKEKLVRGEKITRLDKAIEEGGAEREIYGESREHLVKQMNKNFLQFNLIRDGDDLALSFTKITGDAAIRYLDNTVLAEMLNQILTTHPDLVPPSMDQQEHLLKR